MPPYHFIFFNFLQKQMILVQRLNFCCGLVVAIVQARKGKIALFWSTVKGDVVRFLSSYLACMTPSVYPRIRVAGKGKIATSEPL